MDESYSFLGTGWSFPPKFTDKGGKLNMVSGAQDVEQSIKIILSTLAGERIMRPEFGCDFTAFSFRNLSDSAVFGMQDTVRKALDNYEPRIELNSLGLTQQPEEGTVIIDVDYTVIESNARYNMVFPYYLYESQSLDF
jgi:hypothetical protein